MPSPRMPIRLLEEANIADAYPRELVGNFTNGDLTLVGPDGTTQVKVPGQLSIESSGSGNAITALAVSGHKITITKGSSFLTAHPKITMGTDTTTGGGQLAYGDSVTIVDGVTKDSNGHVTKINTKTVTLPAAQTTVSGNAGSATKLAAARTIKLTGAAYGETTFDGSADAEIEVASIAAGNITGLSKIATTGAYADLSGTPDLADVATSGAYGDLSGTPTIPSASSSTDAPKAPAATAVVGESVAYARADHVHPLQTTVSGNAGTATTLKTARNIGISGVTATAASFDGSKDINITITAIPNSLITGLKKVATSGSYNDLDDKPTIPSASTTSDTPNVAGTAAIGTSDAYARADHVHPAQTDVSGNAGTATKLKTARNIALTSGATGSASFDGSKDISIEVTALDPEKISGTIPISKLPAGALERLYEVDTDADRLALTVDKVQNGDVVSVNDTGLMYFVKDDSKLGTASAAEAFKQFTAGTASAVDWSGVTNKPTFASVATSGSYNDLGDKPTIPSASSSSDTPKDAGTAAAGTSAAYARADHVHAAQTSVTGNAGTATILKTARNIGLEGVTATAASFNGSQDVNIKITAIPNSLITGLKKVATTGDYGDLTGTPTIPTPADNSSTSTELPKEPAATASAGTSDAYARADHVHPLQTSVSGNAGTATKFETAKSVALTGDVTGSASSQAGWSVATTLSTTGVTAGTYGQTADATPAHGDTITVPSVTVDAKGRITGAADATITLPGESDVGVTTSGSGNAVTAIEQSGHGIKVTKGSTFLTAHPTITKSTDTTSTGTPGFGETFTAIDSVSRDTNGHVTKVNTKTITLPAKPAESDVGVDVTGSGNAVTAIETDGHGIKVTKGSTFLTAHPTITTADDTTSTATATHGGTFTAVDGVTRDGNGHVTKINTKTVTLPSETGLSLGTTTGTGNAVTAITVSGHTITMTKGSTFLTAHPAVSKSTDSTSTATATHGGTFTAVDGVTRDTYGHVTKINTKTVTLPSETSLSLGTTSGSGNAVTGITVSGHTITMAKGSTFALSSHTHSAATTSAAGFMSAADKTALNGKATTATYTATIGTSWSGSAAPYTQAITVSGITANDNPIVDVKPSNTYATGKAQVEAWGSIYRIVTAANKITVYANEKTTTSIPIQLKCVR